MDSDEKWELDLGSKIATTEFTRRLTLRVDFFQRQKLLRFILHQLSLHRLKPALTGEKKSYVAAQRFSKRLELSREEDLKRRDSE